MKVRKEGSQKNSENRNAPDPCMNGFENGMLNKEH